MKLNRRKKYYKVIHENGKHYEMTYQEGLNVNVEPFNDNPAQTCCAGRIYFTDKENLDKYYYCGEIVWEVKVPNDAKWIGEEDKIGADKIILKNPVPLWKFILTHTNQSKKYSVLVFQAAEQCNSWWPVVKDRWPEDDLHPLIKCCNSHFTTWWPDIKNKRLPRACFETFPTRYYKHFDLWWPTLKNDIVHVTSCLWAFPRFLPDKFQIWWPDIEYKLPEQAAYLLAVHCPDHIATWWPRIKEQLYYIKKIASPQDQNEFKKLKHKHPEIAKFFN